MNEQTKNLEIPYILPSQAQKHVTCNEAFSILDTLVQLSVLDWKITTPPDSAQENDRYIIPMKSQGSWENHENKIAVWKDNAWFFHTPKPGWLCWASKENNLLIFNGSVWGFLNFQNIHMLGINATADLLNKFVISSDYSLFNHSGTSHQQKINKATQQDTASIVFQTNYTGCIEIGSIKDNNLKIKVSPDGKKWFESIVIDSKNGNVGIGSSNPTARFEIQGETTYDVCFRSQTKKAGSSSGGRIELHHNNGTGNSLAKSGDKLGQVCFGTTQANGSGLHGASIIAYAEGNYVSDTSIAPTRLSFETKAEGSPLSLERVVIKSNGKIGIGNSNPNALLDVSGVVRIGQFSRTSLPSALESGAGSMIYVQNNNKKTPFIAFSDGKNWREIGNGSLIKE